jgi:hypothetical protein
VSANRAVAGAAVLLTLALCSGTSLLGCADLWGFQPITDSDAGADASRESTLTDAPHQDVRDASDQMAPQGTCDGGPLCKIVLMGGDNGAAMSDTWLWDGNSWERQEPASGPSTLTQAMAGPLNGKVVLFGGNPSANPFSTTTDNATWTWIGTTWTQDFPMEPPQGRVGGSMAPLGSTLVLYGGSNYKTYIADTWLWNGTSWKSTASPQAPSPRFGVAMGNVGGKVVLFGGGNDCDVYDDTWEWDGTSWSKLTLAKSPPARAAAASATLAGKLVVFGGYGVGTEIFSDTWEWDGVVWIQVATTGPAGRYEASMATLNDAVVLFGGFDFSEDIFGDTWVWDGSKWTERVTHPSPAPRGNAAMSGP